MGEKCGYTHTGIDDFKQPLFVAQRPDVGTDVFTIKRPQPLLEVEEICIPDAARGSPPRGCVLQCCCTRVTARPMPLALSAPCVFRRPLLLLTCGSKIVVKPIRLVLI
jgi:hypothetical protein